MVILGVYEIGSVCGTRGGVDSKWILGHVWSQCGKLSKDTKFYQDSSRNRIKTHLSSVSCSFIMSELNAMHFLRLRHVMSYGFKMFNYYIYHVYHILYIHTITSRYFENVKLILTFSYIPYVGDIFKPQNVLRTDDLPPEDLPPNRISSRRIWTTSVPHCTAGWGMGRLVLCVTNPQWLGGWKSYPAW